MCLGLACEALCCAGKSICDFLCMCCKCACRTTLKQQIKLTYIFIITLCMLFTIVVLYYIADWFSFMTSYIHCRDDTGGKLQCLGISAAYRMSFSLAIIHFLLFLACLPRNQFSKDCNEGLWPLKILLIFGMFFAFFFIPNSFFEGYATFAKVIGLLFVIFQIVMLIDLFYCWKEKMIKEQQSGNSCVSISVIIFTIINLIGVVALIVLNFNWFASDTGCGLNIFVNSLNIVMVVIQYILSILWQSSGALINSGLFSLYLTYLTWSGLGSTPELSCNQFYESQSFMSTQLAVGFILIIVTWCYLALGSTENSSSMIPVGQGGDAAGTLIGNSIDEDDENSEDKDDDEERRKQNNQQFIKENNNQNRKLKNYQNNNYIYFHIILTISSIYICNLLTNWGSPNIDSTKSLDAFQPGWTSYWIQIIGSWIAFLVYIWTLIAPKILTNRSFGPE